MKTLRQPKACTAAAVGAVETNKPTAPIDMTSELASARRGSGTQMTTALKPLIRPPAKPMPMMARATVRTQVLVPNANNKAPSAPVATSAA